MPAVFDAGRPPGQRPPPGAGLAQPRGARSGPWRPTPATADLNSASLQPGRLEPVADLAAGGRAGVVALCMDADGVPQGRMRACAWPKLATALTGRGVAEEEIYLDR